MSRSGISVLVAGAAVVLIAYWLRDPIIPYGGGTARASDFSADSAIGDDGADRRESAVRALGDAVRATQLELATLAAAALDAPAAPAEAFPALRELVASADHGILLIEGGQPTAWAGQIRTQPRFTGPGTSVTFTDFYVTLQVVLEKGARRAIATSLIHADPPADQLAQALDARVEGRGLVESFRFAPVSDSTQGSLIAGAGGHPLMRADATPLSPERVRFASAARVRARGVIVLALTVLLMVGVAWSDRAKLGRRLLALAVALVAIAITPWNNFSNFSRAFDPAYYYLPPGGPFTANAGAFLMLASLAVLAVIAVIRARRTIEHRIVAGIGALLLVAAGLILARTAATGIALPRWGSTSALWLLWQLPVFLTLFACWLGAAFLVATATRRRAMIHLRSAALIAVVTGAIATFLVWNNTTEQRLQLAMRDVAGLERADSDAAVLLARFGDQLGAFDAPGTRADLLKRFAVSDLAAAEVQVSLGLWDANGTRYGALDLALLRYDSLELVRAVMETNSNAGPVLTQTLGPSGRLITMVVAHRGGGWTTVVASPRTRLVAQDTYAALLGFDQPDQSEPPYLLTLGDVTMRRDLRPGTMTWRRMGDEWHGDQTIATSLGAARAHVQVDLRAWSTRLVRASLVVIVDVAIVAILWALGAMAEGGFVRWVRGRASRWGHSYSGRLTLALFTFFVVPAVAFAGWSYQRLRGDDRRVRELLVQETLNSMAGDTTALQMPAMAGATPFFLYSQSMLAGSSDPLYAMVAPAGRLLPEAVHRDIAVGGELSASWQQRVSNSTIFWGYRAASSPAQQSYVLAAPARSDEIVLDRRRRDLTMLVLFATAVGGIAAFWLSGIAARILARDLELSRIEVGRAERVLAWGEMARQVAHEIKNPLTPIRLGVQHLSRARADNRIDFDRVLDENVARILAQIDRLDEIAKAFSRYGSAPSELPPAEWVDVASILRDVVGLEKIGIGGVSWTLHGADEPLHAAARADELRDVLLNVFENARLARARNVGVTLIRADRLARIEIVDDGSGISPAALPRVFEPHFSTRTTGSGLGLAISRRLLESWGGTIDLAAEEGSGAKVVITLHSEVS